MPPRNKSKKKRSPGRSDPKSVLTFQHVHKDVERYLTAKGLRETRADGMIVFRGYTAAHTFVVREYMKREAYAPLVEHFRGWNWEVGDNKFLLDLTSRLKRERNWKLLKKLWDGVLSKRRLHFTKLLQVQRREPTVITDGVHDRVKAILLSTLLKVRRFAATMATKAELDELDKEIARVRRQ